MKFLLAVLGACLVLASARPSRKRGFGMEDAYNVGGNDDAVKALLQDASTDDIRQGAKELTNDIEAANKDIEDLLGAGDVVDDNFNVNPKFVEIGAKYASDFEKAAEDFNNLPPLPPREDLHFLDQCIKEAEKVNWNDKSLKDFINDVVKQGLTCMNSGMKILIETADLDGVKDEDLTVQQIGTRLSKAKQVMVEMGHLLRFMMGLERELMKGDKSFNEIVDFSENDATKPPVTPSKRKLEERELVKLLRELNEFARGRGKGGKRPDDKDDGSSKQDDDRDGTRPPRPKGTKPSPPEGSKPPRPEGSRPPRPEGSRPPPEDEREFLANLLREFSLRGRGDGRRGGRRGDKDRDGGNSQPDDEDDFSKERDGTRPPRPRGTRPPRPDGTRPPRPDGTRPPRPDGTRPPRPDGTRPPRPEDERELLKNLLRELNEFTRGRKGGKGQGDKDRNGGKSESEDENDDFDGTKPPKPDGTKPPKPDGTKPPKPEGTKPPGPKPSGPPREDKQEYERELLRQLVRAFDRKKWGKKGGKGKGKDDDDDDRKPKGTKPPRPEGSKPPRPEGSKPPRPEGSRPPRPEGSRPPRPEGSRPPRPDGTRPPRTGDKKNGASGFLDMIDDAFEKMKRNLFRS